MACRLLMVCLVFSATMAHAGEWWMADYAKKSCVRATQSPASVMRTLEARGIRYKLDESGGKDDSTILQIQVPGRGSYVYARQEEDCKAVMDMALKFMQRYE